jgi:hypothetical protein
MSNIMLALTCGPAAAATSCAEQPFATRVHVPKRRYKNHQHEGRHECWRQLLLRQAGSTAPAGTPQPAVQQDCSGTDRKPAMRSRHAEFSWVVASCAPPSRKVQHNSGLALSSDSDLAAQSAARLVC